MVLIDIFVGVFAQSAFFSWLVESQSVRSGYLEIVPNGRGLWLQ